MPITDGRCSGWFFDLEYAGIGVAAAATSSCRSMASRTASDAAGDVLSYCCGVWRVCMGVVMGSGASRHVIAKMVEAPVDEFWMASQGQSERSVQYLIDSSLFATAPLHRRCTEQRSLRSREIGLWPTSCTIRIILKGWQHKSVASRGIQPCCI